MPTAGLLNTVREPGCWAVGDQVKYFRVGDLCIKRTLREHEWCTLNNRLYFTPYTTIPQRWKNDAAIVAYVRQHTDIPVPRIVTVYEDDGAFYHVSEYIKGTPMHRLSHKQMREVMPELLRHIATMKSPVWETPGIPPLPDIPPPPSTNVPPPDLADTAPKPPLLVSPPGVSTFKYKANSCWRPHKDVRGRFVLCHNDLDFHNILVDPETLKITAIIDWEYGGFCPEWFERPYWEKLPAKEYKARKAGNDEDDSDSDSGMPSRHLVGNETEDDYEAHLWRCREWLMENCEEVEMPYLLTLKDKLGDELQTPEDVRFTPKEKEKAETKALRKWKEKQKKRTEGQQQAANNQEKQTEAEVTVVSGGHVKHTNGNEKESE